MGEIAENVESNPKRKMTVVIIVSVLVVIAMMVSVWVWGSRGLAKVLIGFLIFMIIISVIFLIVFLVVKLLYAPKINMLAVVQNRLKQGAELRKPDGKVKVFLQGDNKDYEKKFIGMLNGITESVIPPVMDEKTKKVAEKSKRILFLMVKSGTFSKEKIIGVLRDDLSNPSMDEVYIKDTTLSPPFGGVLFPRKYAGSERITEVPIGDYVKRYTLEALLKDFKLIIDDAIQANPEHQKSLEQKGVLERIGEAGEGDRQQ